MPVPRMAKRARNPALLKSCGSLVPYPRLGVVAVEVVVEGAIVSGVLKPAAED